MLVLLRTAVFEILHDNFLKMPKITTKRCYNFLKILYASETKNATVVLIGIPESFVSRSFMSNARAKSVEIERLLLFGILVHSTPDMSLHHLVKKL